MSPALSLSLCALLTLTSLARARGQTTSENSTTQNSASNTSTTENSTAELSYTGTSFTETSAITLSQFSTTKTQTSTALPGPFPLTQSVVFLSDGTQEEVELLFLRALDVALAEATKIRYGPFVGLTGQAVKYEFLHHGHCAAGWMNANIATDDVEACALHCQDLFHCGFFAWDTVSKTCAVYQAAHGCPDDNNFATYTAYTLVRILCSDGLSLLPVTPSECPSNQDIIGCAAARPGSLCGVGDYRECGSVYFLDTCGYEGYHDIYRKEPISCIDDAQCPKQFRCTTDSGVCVSDVTYANLAALAIAELEPPSADVEAIGAFLEGLGDVLPELPDVENPSDAFDGLGDLGLFLTAAVFGDDPNVTAGGSAAAVWRIDLEVVASDVYSLEQVYEALGRLRDEDTWQRAAFLDVVQAIADNHSVFFDNFVFSLPREGQPTNTTAATQTATIATTASTSRTATIATTASRSEPTTTAYATSTATTATTSAATATATTTTTAALTTDEASRQPGALVESSTPIIVGVAGGALVLLAALFGAAVLVLRRRKAVDAFQHKEPDCREPECKEQEGAELEGNDWDVERATSGSGTIHV